MDPTEKTAFEYLQTLGFSQIQYEPDGKVPPDFLCDGRVAVEVRRLNQSFVRNGVRRGLEEDEIRLFHRIDNLLASFGRANGQRSWFIFYKFSRPVPKWKLLRPLIERELHMVTTSEVLVRYERELAEGFSMELLPAGDPHGNLFLPGGYVDQDAGGWVLSEVADNLRICIAEKAEKVAEVRRRYPEWWLVLVDRIAYGFDEIDGEQFRKTFVIDHPFDEVVLIDPQNPARSFEV